MIPSLIDKTMPQLIVVPKSSNNLSTTHLSAQRFSQTYDVETLPNNDVTLEVAQGDEITQSVIVRTDGYLQDLAFSFFEMNVGHYIVPADIFPLDNHNYLVIATKVMEKDATLRLIDIFSLHIANGSYMEFDAPYVALTNVGG